MATAATPKGKAVLIGATGAIGCCLFGELLRCKEHFEKIVVFGRNRKAPVPEGYGVNAEEEEASGRLIQHIQDFDEIPESKIRELCAGSSVFFSCMGTTRKQAGSAQAFYHIDCELNVKFATAAKAEDVPHFSLVTSYGANPTSWMLYTKTKGQLEEAVKELNFKSLTILRPGLLDRGQERRRFMEKVVMIVSSGLPVATVAQAMLYDAITVMSADTVRDPSLIVANNALIRQWAVEGTKKGSAQDKPKAEATSDEQPKIPAVPAESTPAVETTESTPAAETTESTPAAETTESSPAAETTESTPAVETTESTPPAETTESSPAAETTESTPAVETTESTPPAETTESSPAAVEVTESTTAEETKAEEKVTTESVERADEEATAEVKEEEKGEGTTAEGGDKEEEQKEE